MSLKIDRVQLEIIVQQDSARQKMIELEKQMKAANRELNKIKKQFGENSQEYQAQAQVVRDLKQQYDDLFNEIGIGHLSMRELANRQRELNAILRNLDPSLPEWEQYNKQLKEVNARIKELKGTATETGLSISKLADGFNRYAGMAAGAIATLTGMTLTMRQCVDEYAKMEEAESQAIKYTGMTREEVKQLNEQFKQMDTRTPREELNRLAGEAGKLGITGVDNVREFVEAANQINVALGEDLGEEAVNQIGKLSQMFGDESRSLRDNMLAIGSAVNQVAQSTSASEPYLVEFTARMGGVGKQAGMSVTDIMGFASALDQNMLRSEMASTALSGLILRIYQEPAKYARLAQMDVEEFTRLMQTDVNAAVISFLEALNKMGGMAQIAPVLKEMQLSGAEAASVISTLAGNVDLVRREQENANKAFAEGTSITGEYNVQNNTVQAGLEKARKSFQEVRIELGERLEPVMKNLISFGSLTVKGLLSLIKAFDDYRGVIITTTTAVGLYTAAVNVSVIADKAKVLWTGRIVAGLKSLFTLLRANPWGIAAAAVGVLTGLFIDLKRKQDSVTESMRSMERINKTATEDYDRQASRVELLTAILHNERIAQEQRIKALNELKSIIPGYNGMLDDEGRLTNDNTEAIKAYLTQLEKQIKLKAAQEELEELYRRKRQSEKQLAADEQRFTTAQRNLSAAESTATVQASRMGTSGTRMLASGLNQGVKTMRSEFQLAEQAVTNTKKQLSGIEQAIADINNEIMSSAQSTGTPDPVNPELGTGTTTTGTTGTPADDAIKALEERYKQELESDKNFAKQKKLQRIKNGEDEKLIQEEYNNALYQAEIAYLSKQKKLLEDNKQDTTEIQGQIYDKMIAEANRVYEAQKNADFGKAEADAEKERQAAKQAFISGDIADEEAYRQRLLDIEREYLEERKRLLEKYGMDTTEVEGQLLDRRVEQKQGDNRQQKRDRRTQREEGFRAIDSTDDFGQKNDILNQMYADDLVSFEEYQEEKTHIAEEQEEMRKEIAQSAMQLVGQAASSASQLINALQDAEISKVERKYDKQIQEARKAGKDTTKLEEEKEAAVNEIKKKYADKQFATAVLQVTASTAVAAMEAYKAMAGIPVVGPALGAAAAAAAVVAGAAQIAVAKQQRDEAKGLYSGGFSKDYIEGYTAPGNPHDTAGVIPVHKNEFVANHEAVANPAVKQFLDVFDVAQKRGTIRMLNTTQILEQVRTRGGRYEGGYTDTGTGDARSSASPFAGMTAEQRSQVVVLLQENNRLLTILTEKELVVDPRKMRDAINRVNRLEKNVSR